MYPEQASKGPLKDARWHSGKMILTAILLIEQMGKMVLIAEEATHASLLRLMAQSRMVSGGAAALALR